MAYQQKQLQRYIRHQQQDAQELLKDTVLLRKLVLQAESQKEFDKIAGKKYGFFVFAETISDSADMLFWNNQKMIPRLSSSYTDSLYFTQLSNGYYVVQRSQVFLSGMSNRMMAYVLIPVLYKYYVETENSLTEFAHDRDAIKKIALTAQPTEYPVQSAEGKTLFHVKQASYSISNTDTLTIVLRFAALVLLLIALHLLSRQIHIKYGAVKAILFLSACLIFLRGFLFFFPEVLALRQFELFNPTVYGSDKINRSLGDLLISAVFLSWIILFAWNYLGPIRRLPSFLKGKGIIVAGVMGIFGLVFISFQLANVVHGLVADSKISFEVTDFFNLRIYTVFSFIVLALLSLSYYYFSRLLFRFVLLAFPNLVHLYFVIAVVGLFLLTVQGSYASVLFHLPVLIWLVLFTLLLTQEQFIINRFRITYAGILFWMFVFSVSLSLLIMQGNREREQGERKSYAEKLEELTEPSKEKTLLIALSYLDSNFLKANFHRFYTEPENSLLRDSIVTASNAPGYKRSYNTSIFIFDSLNQSVHNEEKTSYVELNSLFTARSKPTPTPDLFYYETSFDQFVYIIKREVFNDNNTLKGTLFIQATPKQFQNTEALYPEIFKANKRSDEKLTYSYAVYKNNKLRQYSSQYSFPVVLHEKDIPAGEFVNNSKDDYDELWFKASNQKIIIVAKKKDSLLEGITLFSYLFCAFLLMVGFIRLLRLIASLAKTWPQINLFSQLNIRSQIQGTIIFITVLSFVVIGIATISFFITRSNRNNTERLILTANRTMSELKKRMKENNLMHTPIDFSDTTVIRHLRRLVDEIAEVHGEIANVYDLHGTLKVTSDELIYRKGVLSMKMEPTGYFYMNNLHEAQLVQRERFGDLEYSSIYTAIRNENGDTYAYLNIPSFTSQLELNQEISNLIVTIINLNAFIVLLASVIALFITNRITRSFSVIADKMKAITLGRTNEEIVWNKSDEIGELVKQYNKMVRQLEASAEALAKSEREGAWREMARQVAHEIKNPLTPMKLSIQYLQKAIQNNQPNVQALTTNVANTLIEQIDHLSKIASDFSQFANIGNKRIAEIDLHDVLGSLIDLYASNPKVAMTWNTLPGDAKMKADKTHMNRLFTNLLTNAVDACSERKKCVVTISEEKINHTIVVSISDNGDGIPLEMQSKIFTPNFTTKTSGTGLGLAMCKGIVEQAGGNIWFQTKEGEGTTFFVQLPLMA